jgi:hypothetical protein
MSAEQQSLGSADVRVRGMSATFVTLLNKGIAESMTFRRLVERINQTDGIVYVGGGECGDAVRACLLLTMTLMGPHRVLWVRIDPLQMDRELIASIGHELQHALEVLSHRNIRSSSTLTLFYKRQGYRVGQRVETDSAVKAGNAVRGELR